MAKVVYILRAVWELLAFSVVGVMLDNISENDFFRDWDSLIEMSIFLMIFWVVPVVISLIKEIEFNLITENIGSLIVTIVICVLLYKGMPFIVLIVFLYNSFLLIFTFKYSWCE